MLDAISVIRLNNLFKVNRMDKMPFEESNKFHVNVTVEMDLTVNMYERQVYTIFQMLSDFEDSVLSLDTSSLNSKLVGTIKVSTTSWSPDYSRSWSLKIKLRKKHRISENQNSSSSAVRLTLGTYLDVYRYAVFNPVNLAKSVLCKWLAISWIKRSISLRLSSIGAISRGRFIMC